MILLDTNVISEFMIAKPDERVVRWLDQQPLTSIWTTSISVFEVRIGLLSMQPGKRRTDLETNFQLLLNTLLLGRIVDFDLPSAEQAASLEADRRRKGRPIDDRDTMIAGIVLANHAQFATRNLKHFEDIASFLLNPWQE